MVMCAMDSVLIPRPPPLSAFLKHSGVAGINDDSRKGGFRLLDNQDDTGSVYSVYKQKIDAMFESDSSSTKNSVQARIEKMFTDVAIDSGIPINDYGCHHFSVDYLGSVPLQEKVTSLSGLQKPLWDLYFAYKRITKHKKILTGRLEISASGLKVQYQGEKGDLEQLNSFPTIAVWSAVKFVLHEGTSCAFVPLITDPDNVDKQQLFRDLDLNERKLIGGDSRSPLFAVVMRKIGVHKQLECHGFVCQTSEDAIVIAATLYKSLMSHMKAKEKKPKNRNGVTCMSVASSAFNEGSVPVRPPRKKRSTASSATSDIDTIDTETAPLLQEASTSQPPKKSTKTRRAPRAPSEKREDPDAIVTYEEAREPAKLPLGDKWNTYKSNHQKQITAEIKQVMTESSNMGLKRVKSLRKRNEELQSNENSGDILTKVTIPRSGSFLNAGGLTRYKSKVQRLNGQATGGSPLGFNELFNEFRLQEGLHSMDEILGVIIDPEGMSFNDLKPIYKEFLLKLAVTLTKDELYQRSKAIMRRQKKKLLRRTSSAHQKKRSVIVCGRFKRLKHVFQKLRVKEKVEKVEEKLPESTISSTSYDTRHFTPKAPVTRKRDKRDSKSTSEESDFFSLKKGKMKHNNHNRNSSSGYVSCSECSFDSDTCTCVSADKCYCSLRHNNQRQDYKQQQQQQQQHHQQKCCCQEDSLTWCGCDTDSCTDSNKCYCNGKGTIFEQLKRRGFIPSAESISTPPTSRRLCKKNSNTKSTKSLEYMHNPTEKYYEKLKTKRNKDHLGLDYDIFSIANRSLYSRAESRHFCRESMRSRGPRTLKSAVVPPDGCTEALSVKKSAEIAALFADIKLSQTTDITQIIPRHPGRMISNSLYSAKAPMKSSLYSAKNGLYTIQSQSDDSSRGKSDRDYFKAKNKVVALESSLGYLP